MAETAGERIVRLADAARTERQTHESTWRDCFDHTFPIRSVGLTNTLTDAPSLQAEQARLLTSVGTESARTLAAQIQGGMTPSNSLWFGLDVGDESGEERAALDDAAQLLWENIHLSNYDAESLESVTDITGAGWGVLYVDEDPGAGGFRFEHWPMSQCYVGQTKPGGRIDKIDRRYSLTAEQIIEEFGEEYAGKEVRDAYAKNPGAMFEVLRSIYPRKDGDGTGRLASRLPFASCTVLVKTKTVLREGGYHEFPCIVPRWFRIPSSAYAVGPAYQALPDLRELNDLLFLEAAALDIAVSGQYVAVDDGVLNPRTMKVGARQVIVANSTDSIKPLETGANFQVSFTKREQLEAQVRRVFMADQLQPQDGPAMTATEVHVRVGLIRQLLGPIYGRLQAEYLQPLIERCFGIAYRAGVFTLPRSLANREMHIRYVSPLARAQRLEEVTAMDRHETALFAEAQARPEVLDTYDFDEAARTRAKLLGVPHALSLDVERVKRIRELRQRAQAQQQAQAGQQAMAMQAMKA